MIRTWAVRVYAPTTPPPFFPLAPPFSSSSSSSVASSTRKHSAMPRSIRIAIVGDVHDDWDLEEDSKALHFLQPDLVLFTGDFGNENIKLVRSISNLDIPKSVILGNHDCWQTHQFSVKKADRVQLQLECLGEQHVGYNRMDFPTLQLSVVGGRPFSCGGENLFRPRLLSARKHMGIYGFGAALTNQSWNLLFLDRTYMNGFKLHNFRGKSSSMRYGVNDMEGSAKKICEAASGTPEGHSIVLLAHNGPTGLGSRMNDICGRDWVYGGGDHGDPDLAQAMLDLKSNTCFPIPLVVFGHMHKALAYGSGQRKMIVVSTDGTIYLNGAIVPRVKHESERGTGESKKDGTLRTFTLVEILDGRVEKIAETWVLVDESRIMVEEENILFKSS